MRFPSLSLLKFGHKNKRVMGIEPTYPAWKAGVLPLNYTRMRCEDFYNTMVTKLENTSLSVQVRFRTRLEKTSPSAQCVPRTGIEPVTRGFSVLCSTNWAIWANCFHITFMFRNSDILHDGIMFVKQFFTLNGIFRVVLTCKVKFHPSVEFNPAKASFSFL